MRKVKELHYWIDNYDEVHKLVEELALAFDFIKEDLVTEEEIDDLYARTIGKIEQPQHIAQLKLLNLADCAGIKVVDFLLGDKILLDEVEGKSQLLHEFADFVVVVDPIMQFFHFAYLSLGSLLVAPEVGHMSAQFFFFYFDTLAIDVKETSSARPRALASLLVALV